MKTFSYSQQKLLDVLRITPLKPNCNFAAETLVDTPVETLVETPIESSTASDKPILHAPDLAVALALDIQLALPEGFNWQINALSDKVELSDKLLLTPMLEKLQQAESKKALWRLLSTLYED